MSLEFNKISAAVLVTGIALMVTGILAEILIPEPDAPSQPAYVVEGVEAVGADAGGATDMPKELPPISPLLASADVAAGEALTKKCTVCHSFNEGGPNKVGPNMWNVVGNKKAHIDGFAYSDALKNMQGVWGYEELNKFLLKPKDYVPGTKMVFAGLKKEQDRANLIAYLRTLSASPKPLP